MSSVTCHMPHVMCHVSHVTCHVSCVTCHIPLFFLFFLLQSGWARRWRVCYQRGLPHLVLRKKTNLIYKMVSIMAKLYRDLRKSGIFLIIHVTIRNFLAQLLVVKILMAVKQLHSHCLTIGDESITQPWYITAGWGWVIELRQGLDAVLS